MLFRNVLAVTTLLTLMGTGCSGPTNPNDLNAAWTTPRQMDVGIVYILPGIQGVDYHYKNLRSGLGGAGIKCAIKIEPWGTHIPGIGLAINETNTSDDRQWARKIARQVQDYQHQYPGRPVYLLGQSAGCAIAIFTAEELAKAKAAPVEGIIMLDASLSTDYDLTMAMGQSRKGIVNFYNLRDVAMLEVGTRVFGNVDGGHGDSAGRTGFADGKYPKLYQVRVTREMVGGTARPHFADTSAAFASRYIAPWIMGQTWPVQARQADQPPSKK